MSDSSSSYFGGSVVALAAVAGLAVLIHVGVDTLQGDIIQQPTVDMSAAAVAERIAPVGQLNRTPPPAAAPAATTTVAASGGRSGEAIYNSACMACHAVGVAGAPKFGDVAAWEPRIARGLDALLETAINGKGAMPPRGTCADCSDDELRGTIEYMVNHSQ